MLFYLVIEYSPQWLFSRNYIMICEAVEADCTKIPQTMKSSSNSASTSRNIDNYPNSLMYVPQSSNARKTRTGKRLNPADKKVHNAGAASPLIGVRVSSGHKVQHHGGSGFYFVFSDLSMLTTGLYQLKFTVYEQQ